MRVAGAPVALPTDYEPAILFITDVDGDGLAEEVREGHGHALEDRARGGGDALDVLGKVHTGRAPTLAHRAAPLRRRERNPQGFRAPRRGP